MMAVTPAASVTYRGVEHTGIGNATVSVLGDELVVSNLDPNGGDGVSIDFGQGLNGFGRMASDLSGLPSGSSKTIKVLGRITGVPGQTLWEKTLTVSGSDLQFSADFSGIGSSTYTVEMYWGTVLMASQTSIAGVGVTIPDSPSLATAKWKHWCPKGDKHEKVKGRPSNVCFDGIGFDDGTEATIPGQPSVFVDKIFLLAEGQTAKVDFISGAEIRATGMTEFRHSDLAISFQHILNRALGDVTFAPFLCNPGDREPCLTVGNFGSSGTRGVSILLRESFAESLNFTTLFQTIQMPSTPIGSFLEFSSTGSLGTPGDASLGSLRLTKTGASQLEITADYTPFASSSHTLQVFDGDTLVTTITGHTGPVAQVPIWPRGCKKRRIDLGGGQTLCFRPVWPQAIPIQIVGGPTVLGTELAVLAEGASGSLESLSTFTVLAKDMPDLTITQEVSVTEGQIPTLSVWGLLALAAFLALSGAALLRRRPSSTSNA
jgi:hypothetical protein